MTEEFPIAFCHNDALECNWLMNNLNNSDIMLIDYEYGLWNPMAMDIANYLNECMLDNSYPGKNGIEIYLDNFMEPDELREMSRTYLSRYYEVHMPESVKARYTTV